MAKHHFVDLCIWAISVGLLLYIPGFESRVDEMEQAAQKSASAARDREQQAVSTNVPEIPKFDLKQGKCFHMGRERCPTGPLKCDLVDPESVFCCDIKSFFLLKEGLSVHSKQNVTNLHVLNADIDELDISQSVFRRLKSMAITDGNIGKITVAALDSALNERMFHFNSQFPKHSSLACLNISNNNLTSAKLQPSVRPFAYLYNMSILDASANNLTEFPLSLVHSNRKISVDLSGNNYLPCQSFLKAMESNNNSLVTFANYNQTFCALDLAFNWFKEVQIVQIDHLRVQQELKVSCNNIKPKNISCSCEPERLELLGDEVTNLVAVDCSNRHLKVMPTDLPENTVKLNVSYNNITSLQPVREDPTYEHLRELYADYNDIQSIIELEASKFIDNLNCFSIKYNKLKTIHTYVLSDKFDTSHYATFFIAGNYIHCDCNTEKVVKPWLVENFKNIPDYKSLQCDDGTGPVMELIEYQVCHSPRDWSDYIYYIIGFEVITLVLLISKVSYDYWVFKTAGYLPWPANKMPRLPCDWLCE